VSGAQRRVHAADNNVEAADLQMMKTTKTTCERCVPRTQSSSFTRSIGTTTEIRGYEEKGRDDDDDEDTGRSPNSQSRRVTIVMESLLGDQNGRRGVGKTWSG